VTFGGFDETIRIDSLKLDLDRSKSTFVDGQEGIDWL